MLKVAVPVVQSDRRETLAWARRQLQSAKFEPRLALTAKEFGTASMWKGYVEAYSFMVLHLRTKIRSTRAVSR